MKLNKRNGISLIVLVITIIIMIILAGAIILSLSGTGLITNATKGSFQSDISTMQEELGVYIANKITETKGKYTQDKLYADKDRLEEDGVIVEGKNIQNVLTSIDKKYLDEVEIINGKVVYVGDNLNKLKWANETLLGVKKDIKETTSETQSITLEESANLNLVNYRIYGNSEDNEMGEIESVGFIAENLLTSDTPKEQGYLNSSGEVVATTSAIYSDYYVYTIKVKPNTKYTYESCINHRFTYCLYDADMNFLNIYGGYNNKEEITTFKTTEDTAYVKISSKKSEVEAGNIRCNEGSIIIPEDKYNEYVIPIELKGKNLFNINGYRLVTGYNQMSMCESFENDIWIGKGPEGSTALGSDSGQIFVYFNDSLEANKTYTISFYATLLEQGIYNSVLRIHYGSEYGSVPCRDIGNNLLNQRKKFKFTITIEEPFERIGLKLNNNKWKFELNTLQIEEGTTSTEYSAGIVNKNIYLDEPLRKVDNYVDYIDFRRQEIVRNVEEVNGELKGLAQPKIEKITLPNMLLNEGTNTLSVNARISPSKIETIHYIK